jgi:hypothetical protein
MYRSKLHLHKQTPRLCLIRCGLRPSVTFIVVCAVGQEFTSIIDQKVRRLVRKISGQHTWNFILRKDYYMSLKRKDDWGSIWK